MGKEAIPHAGAGSENERVELRISRSCARRCVFCCEAKGMRTGARFMPAAEAVAAMRALRKKGARHITFLGGEPTLHPDLGAILRAARLLGYATQVTTDGTGLADADRAAALLPYIDELCLSVHWDDAPLARAVTRTARAFSQTEAAFENIARFGRLRLFMCHLVACSLNIGRLGEIARYIFSRGRPGALMVSQLIPWGSARAAYGRLAPRMSRLVKALPELERLSRSRGARLVVSGLPFCALGRFAGLSNDYSFSPRLVLERGRENGRDDVLSVKKSLISPLSKLKPSKCAGCALCRSCPGMFLGYLEKYGAGELKPVAVGAAAGLRAAMKRQRRAALAGVQA